MTPWGLEKTHSVQVDVFLQPLAVGDYVLTKPYSAMAMDHLSRVTKVNKKSLYVELDHNKWKRFSDGTYKEVHHTSIKRHGYDCIKLSKAQVDTLLKAKSNLKSTNPEYFL